MRPDEAVLKALEEEGTMDCADVEKLVELAMRESEWRKAELEKGEAGEMLIDEFRELEKSVKDFDHRSFDLTVLSDYELNEIESSRLPLYHLHDLAYKERLRRCDLAEEERAKEQARRKARYGYYFPDKETLTGWDIYNVKIVEQSMIDTAFAIVDEETAMATIHKAIPTISDEEIEEYRKEAMEEEKSRASEKKVSDQTNEERENQIILNAAPKG